MSFCQSMIEVLLHRVTVLQRERDESPMTSVLTFVKPSIKLRDSTSEKLFLWMVMASRS